MQSTIPLIATKVDNRFRRLSQRLIMRSGLFSHHPVRILFLRVIGYLKTAAGVVRITAPSSRPPSNELKLKLHLNFA